jgi:DNA processing protein
MAAMSDLVFVVEAREKSGTLITAKLALEYNKLLATVPNSIFSDYSKGSNKLIKQRAYPIIDTNDILELLDLSTDEQMLGFEKTKNNNLSEEEVYILRMLSEPQDKNFLIKNSSFNISKLNTLLSILEIKGEIKETLGKYRKI